MVLLLLDAGARPERAELPGKVNSLLHICCDQGMLEAVQRLAGSDYGRGQGVLARAGLLPIHPAALDDDVAMVDALRPISGRLMHAAYEVSCHVMVMDMRARSTQHAACRATCSGVDTRRGTRHTGTTLALALALALACCDHRV